MVFEDEPPRSRMTLGVYRVRPDGTRVTVRPTAPVEPLRDPPFGVDTGFPACACPRHAPRRAR